LRNSGSEPGEIAVRIIRACKELNIRTVAVYSEVDANSMHVQLGTKPLHRQSPQHESYLRIDRIISAAEITDVDAIHGGYGFLSENAHFADVCENCNIVSSAQLSRHECAAGQSSQPRVAKKAGVPTPPGSDGMVRTSRKPSQPPSGSVIRDDQSHRRRRGRGMRAAHKIFPWSKAITPPQRAEKAFGNSGVYIEKLIEKPHHIEFQILGDNRGNIIHLGERDCSISGETRRSSGCAVNRAVAVRPDG